MACIVCKAGEQSGVHAFCGGLFLGAQKPEVAARMYALACEEHQAEVSAGLGARIAQWLTSQQEADVSDREADEVMFRATALDMLDGMDAAALEHATGSSRKECEHLLALAKKLRKT